MYILINIDHGINKNILLKYLVISFNYKFIKLLLHFPSLFSIYILILITVIIVKIALKIAFLPIQLKWLITIIHGGSAKTGSRCTSPLQRASPISCDRVSFPVSLLHEFSPRVTGCADRLSIPAELEFPTEWNRQLGAQEDVRRVYTPREKIKASGKIGGGNCYRCWCHSDYWESEKLQCAGSKGSVYSEGYENWFEEYVERNEEEGDGRSSYSDGL